MQNLIRDVRYAIRTAGRNLGFTLVVVATLGLGIGANTAIFSVVDAVVLRALPFPEPERLVSVWADYTRRDGPVREWLSYPNIHDLRNETDVFEEVTVYNDWTPTITGLGDAEQVSAGLVTEGTFSRVLQVAPILGRTFLPEDDRPNAPNVVILSHGFWTRAFGADPSVIGTSISLSEQPHTIIGVMPPGMRPPFVPTAELWRPLQLDLATTLERRGDAVLRSISRLREGVGLEAARSRADALGSRLEQEYPEDNVDIGYAVFPLQDDMVRTARPALLVLLGAVTFVLLVACVNVANLLLARTTARRSELAVRAALGAGSARIAQQILAESAVLAVVGGIVGAGLAFVGTDLLVSLAPIGTPRISTVQVDGRVLAFTAALTLAVGVVFGVVPALRAGRTDFHDALREGGRGADLGRGGGRMRNALIVGQVALALLLLVGAGLFIQSLKRLNAVDPGFDPTGKLTMQLILPSNRYPDRAATTRFYVDLEDRLRAVPGVERVGSINSLPLAGLNGDSNFNIVGRPVPPAGQARIAWIRRVTADYFATMEISLLAGRGFTDSDDPDTPRVIVINETLAERYFSDQNPLGQHIYFGNPDPQYQREIVGVVENVKNFGIRRESPNAIYFPYRQLSSSAMFIAMETAGDPEALIPSVRRAVAEMDPNLAVANLASMESLLQGSLGLDRFIAMLLSLFAGLALLLAAVGLYGVVSYNVNQRLPEMGVRIALGAVSRDIHRIVIGRSLVLVGVGIGAGIAGALAMSRVVSGLLYEVNPVDPLTLVLTAIALVLVAAAASAIPARRATRLDPVAVLNSE
jgi:putative ABC transport system permease protein